MHQTRKITVRAGRIQDIPAIARVHVDSWRTTYQGIIADSFLAGLSCQKHEERHHRYMAYPGTFYFVAESPDNQIVGFLSGGPARTTDPQFTGEIFAIYLLQQHRQQGIGSALVQSWASKLQQMSINSALVWVLAHNTPAVHFYQRMGATYLREQMIEIGGAQLSELAYGWNDLTRLAATDIFKSK